MKKTLNDEKLKEKFTAEDKKIIEETSANSLSFVAQAGESDAEEFEKKQKELEAKCSPIMMRVYQAAYEELVATLRRI
jgi:heat shock protein 1/8